MKIQKVKKRWEKCHDVTVKQDYLATAYPYYLHITKVIEIYLCCVCLKEKKIRHQPIYEIFTDQILALVLLLNTVSVFKSKTNLRSI